VLDLGQFQNEYHFVLLLTILGHNFCIMAFEKKVFGSSLKSHTEILKHLLFPSLPAFKIKEVVIRMSYAYPQLEQAYDVEETTYIE